MALYSLRATVLAMIIVCISASRPVDRYPSVWQTGSVPSTSGFSNPYSGNGDIGVMISAPKPSKDAPRTGELVFSTGKNDFWTSEGKNYFNHLAGPTVTFTLPADNYRLNATQDLGSATVSSTMWSLDNKTTLHTSTVVTEQGQNAVLTQLSCVTADGSDCEVDITLRDCCNNKGSYFEAIGGSATGLWLRKDNLLGTVNPAGMFSCDPDALFYSVERSFVVDSGVLKMSNGSCPWVLNPTNASSPITTGDCSQPQGKWEFQANSSANTGTIAWAGASDWNDTPLCLSGAKLVPCATAPLWTLNPTNGFLNMSGSCLGVQPDNSNNTLAASTIVLDASGSVVSAKSAASPVNSSTVAAGIHYKMSLKSGSNYTVVTAILTLRDIGCAGTREHTETCPMPVQEAASTHALSFSKAGALSKAYQVREAFWESYWNSSSIDLTGGSPTAHPNNTAIEKWYYGMQYSFGTNSREGKVAPSLSGVLVAMDPVPWKDQLTIDYNFESNYWGAGSSNRLEYMKPYVSTVTNPGTIATVRQRANKSVVWNDAPGVRWPGYPGNPGNAFCGGAGACNVSWDLGHKGGYRGASWPSTMFPLGDGRPAPTDLGTRFVGGLVASPLIQYFEYSRDMDALKSRIYPLVKDNAEFYASWAMTSSDGTVSLPYTCAQEGCSCRNNLGWYWRWGPTVKIPLPNMTVETLAFGKKNHNNGVWNTQAGQHNAHADLAFAKASFRKAIEYSVLLNVDSDLRTNWESLLNNMPAYPTTTLHWVKNDSAIIIGSELSGKTMMVEAEIGATPEAAAAAVKAGNSTITWPWCNVEYPITNFAAMWPTDEVANFTDEVRAIAKTTVYGLNEYTGYVFKGSRTPFSNGNGFGLSWPPAVRVSEASDTKYLMDKFSNAGSKAAATNGIVSTGGGMLENMGACAAINEMLFQSYSGVLKFFPVWSAADMGPASFTTLRGYGAFIASASMDASGTVSPIELMSESGLDCAVQSPWPTLVVKSAGKTIATTKQGNVYTFATEKGATYTLSSQ